MTRPSPRMRVALAKRRVTDDLHDHLGDRANDIDEAMLAQSEILRKLETRHNETRGQVRNLMLLQRKSQ